MISYNSFYSVLKRSPNAQALISGSENYPEIRGKILFYNVSGGVVVSAEIFGLPRGNDRCNSPIFALHIHSGSECAGNVADPFANTGGHYNPQNCPHPYHAGDMPPLFSANGRAFLTFLTNRFRVDEIIGKTVIIHGGLDDFTTQPSGNAGEKIACGKIIS